MAVNYGILQQLAAPQVMGQVPVQPNTMDQFAGGLMSGLKQGQDLALGNQQMQINSMNIKAAKSAQMDAQTLRAAAQQGEQQYIQAQMKMDPSAGQAYLLKKAQVQQSIAAATASTATAKNQNAEANTKELDNYSKGISILAQVSNAALSGKNPQQQQQIWQYARQQLPEKQQSFIPEQFDQDAAAASLILAKENMADYLQKNQAKITPDALTKQQDERDALDERIAALKKDGKDTSNLELRRKELDSAIKKTTDKGVISNLTSGVGDAISGAVDSVKGMFNKNAQSVAAPAGRVLVKAPDGTVGHIPESQLNEALKAGYTKEGK